MKEQFIDAVTSGLQGKWTHIDPKRALKELTPATAKKKPQDFEHSCWELLHHIVLWCEIIIKQLKGEAPNWNETQKIEDWPSPESLQDDSNFYELLDLFFSYIEEAQKLLNEVDFTKMSAGWPELSIPKLYMVFLQHTSYHIGQIVVIRKILGDWQEKK